MHWLHIFILMSLTVAERRVFIPLSVLWNDLVDPMFNGVGLTGFKCRANDFLLPEQLVIFLSSTVFVFLFFFPMEGICGAGAIGLIECQSLALGLALPGFCNSNSCIRLKNNSKNKNHSKLIFNQLT